MTQAIDDPLQWENRRRQWIGRVEALINQIDEWANAAGWATARTSRSVRERRLGEYDVPVLRVRLPGGELHVNPVGLNVVGADGRVDIEAFPNLNRVKLIGRGDHWEIFTDSNIPLRQPWSADTFAQVARDLLA